MADDLDAKDYRTLADFRFELRRFLHFSEGAAKGAGLSPQQHQALLAIRAGAVEGMLVGELAERLMLKPHSMSELVDRLEVRGLVSRRQEADDKRRVHIVLTDHAREILATLSTDHRAELRRLKPLLQRLLDAL